MNDLQNIYRSACLVTEFEAGDQVIRIWGDRTHVWLDPIVERWQGVLILLNAAAQQTVVQNTADIMLNSLASEEDLVCDSDQIDLFLSKIIANPSSVEALILIPWQVSNVEHQRWIEQLDWYEDDGPLHFFQCSCHLSERTVSDIQLSSVVIPVEAVDIWLHDWCNAYFYWKLDRPKALSWIASGQQALRYIPQQQSHQTLDYFEAWARQINRLDSRQEETHEQWNQLHLALVPHGIFEQEDGGMLGYQLVEQGYTSLARYREAAIALYAHASVIPGILLPDCAHPLAATVSLHWFLLGPFHSEQQDVVAYLNYCVPSFVRLDRRNVSSSFASSCSTGGSGAFWYAKGVSHSQLYSSTSTVQRNTFDGYRLSVVSARLSRAGHTMVARAIAALAILHEPEQFQHWVELGMALWYDNRQAEGMACLAQAAKIDQGFAGTPFFNQRQAQITSHSFLPSNPGEYYLNEALPDSLSLWSTLPAEFLYSLVWLRSLVAEPRFQFHWFALMDAVGDGYLCREIFRGLKPNARNLYLSGRSPSSQKRLQAHIFKDDC